MRSLHVRLPGRRLAAVGVAVAALLATLGITTPAVAAQPTYYLSLGDSIAFGYQPDLVAAHAPITDFRSYAEDFTTLRPRYTLVNYGCPGETTTTMMQGGCPWLAAGGQLHDSYGSAPSQLAAGLAFLRAHRGRVPVIAINIGSNDLLAIEQQCGTDPVCLAQHVGNPADPAPGTLFGNLAAILAQVHATAPRSHILVFDYYNPLAIALPASDTPLALINAALVPFDAAFGTHRVDAFGAINRHYALDGTVSWSERTGICLFTWECTAQPNIHPNDTGYYRLMLAMARALAASRL